MRAELLDRDIAEIGWEADPSSIVSLPARYWLGSRRDERGELQPFDARAINISTEVIALTGPALSWGGRSCDRGDRAFRPDRGQGQPPAQAARIRRAHLGFAAAARQARPQDQMGGETQESRDPRATRKPTVCPEESGLDACSRRWVAHPLLGHRAIDRGRRGDNRYPAEDRHDARDRTNRWPRRS